MTFEEDSAYLEGSVVNSLAHQKLLFLRQREADAHWDARAKEKMKQEKPKKRRAPRFTQMSRAEKSDEKHAIVVETQKVRNQLITQFISMSGIETDWKPGSHVPPPNPKSQNDFATQAGIKTGHYKQLESGQVVMTLDDAVKIARAYDMDIATFLLPDIDNLEKSTYFDLQPTNQQHGPIYMHEWVLWIFGYRPLPGQDAKLWRSTTSLPPAHVSVVHGGRPRDPEVRNAELERIRESIVSAYGVLDKNTPRKMQGVPLTPFGKLIKRELFNQKHNHKIIKATLSVATRMKVAFETDSKGKGLKSQLKKFSDSIAVVRNNIVIVVESLLSIGR